MSWTNLRVLPLVATLFATLTTTADASLIGGTDFQVNTYTTSFQDSGRAVVADDGSFVIVWKSVGSPAGDSRGILLQRFDSGGSPLGDEFQVNNYTTGSQERPGISADPDGNFVVVWFSAGSSGDDSDGTSIQARRFAPDATPNGGQFQINSYTTGGQYPGNVAHAPNGGFFVVWESTATPSNPSRGVLARRFDSNGVALGADIEINTYTTGTQTQPVLGAEPDGGFFVVWRSNGSNNGDTSSNSIQGRRYDADGNPRAGQFLVNTYTPGTQTQPALSLADSGEAIVVWQTASPDDADTGIRGRLYDVDGVALGDDFAVNQDTSGQQTAPAVRHDENGHAVLAWNDYGQNGTDTDGAAIRGTILRADGYFEGDDFQINTYTTGSQETPSVAIGTEGKVVVTWKSFGSPGNDTSQSVIARAANLPEIALCPPEPAAGCTTGETGKSKIDIKDKDGDDSKDKTKVKLGKLGATEAVEFGNPIDGPTVTALCIYDASASDQPVSTTEITAGGTCDDKPCWKPKGTKGFAYKSKIGNDQGATGAKLKAGADGKTSLQIKAAGGDFDMPGLGLSLPVTVQILSGSDGEDARCWQATFTAADKNEAARFKAKGP